MLVDIYFIDDIYLMQLYLKITNFLLNQLHSLCIK